jgi:6-phosphogluconolactonase
MERTRTVYVGSGNWGSEIGKIQTFMLDLETGRLELRQEIAAGGIAAFMARSPDGRTLYVADEGKGLLSSYRIDAVTRELTLLNQVQSHGHPVYVAVDRTGRSLITCYFEEAKTEVFAIRSDGGLAESTCLVPSGRESHCTVFDPTHRFLFVPTRGDHWIAQYHFDSETRQLTANEPAQVLELDGAGPRHLAFHPGGRFAFLVGELTLTLSSYAFDPERGTLTPAQRGVPVGPPSAQGGSAADIHVHPSGSFLYVSNRQGDASNLAIFRVDGATGCVTLVGHEPTRGRTPRNFALDPEGRVLIAGNQDSSDLAVFRVTEGGGGLEWLYSCPTAPGPFFIGIY